MKLILAVVEDDDAVNLTEALVDEGLGATKLASTGGFLLRGNTTLLIGVEDNQVDHVLGTISRVCKRRKRIVPQTTAEIPAAVNVPLEVESGGAIAFVLEVSKFQHL